MFFYYFVIKNPPFFLLPLTREKYVEELRAREREEDERYLKQLSISEFPTVRKVHKTEIDYVVEMMVHTYWEHPFMDMFGKKQEEKRELMLLFWKNTCGLCFCFFVFLFCFLFYVFFSKYP